MVSLASLSLGGQALLAVLAWAVVVRSRAHGYVAAYLTWLVGASLARGREGLAWVGLDRALTLSWSFFFLACVVHYFLARSPRILLGLWALLGAALALGPAWSATAFRHLFFANFFLTTGLVWAIILYTALRRRAVRPTLSHLVLVTYAASDAIVAIFPLLTWQTDQWRLAVVSSLVAIGTSLVAHVVVLARPRSPVRA